MVCEGATQSATLDRPAATDRAGEWRSLAALSRPGPCRLASRGEGQARTAFPRPEKKSRPGKCARKSDCSLADSALCEVSVIGPGVKKSSGWCSCPMSGGQAGQESQLSHRLLVVLTRHRAALPPAADALNKSTGTICMRTPTAVPPTSQRRQVDISTFQDLILHHPGIRGLTFHAGSSLLLILKPDCAELRARQAQEGRAQWPLLVGPSANSPFARARKAKRGASLVRLSASSGATGKPRDVATQARLS